MKRFILVFLVFIACSQGAEVESAEPINVVSDSSFSFINSDLVEDSVDLIIKKKIIIFWEDYKYGPTLEWVDENLEGKLKIGFSTPQLRDYFKVVGQPITLILDTNGEVIFRDFGEIKFTNF